MTLERGWMPRPKSSNKLSIKEGVWYSAHELVELGFIGYCCGDRLAQHLKSFLVEYSPAGLEYSTKPGWPDFDWEVRRWLGNVAIFMFTSRGRAKAIHRRLRIMEVEERFGMRQQFVFDCECSAAARDERQRQRSKKYGGILP